MSPGISIRVASPKLVMEEAPNSYKDVTSVVDTCHAAGISKKAIKLRPIAVIKGQKCSHCRHQGLGHYRYQDNIAVIKGQAIAVIKGQAKGYFSYQRIEKRYSYQHFYPTSTFSHFWDVKEGLQAKARRRYQGLGNGYSYHLKI